MRVMSNHTLTTYGDWLFANVYRVGGLFTLPFDGEIDEVGGLNKERVQWWNAGENFYPLNDNFCGEIWMSKGWSWFPLDVSETKCEKCRNQLKIQRNKLFVWFSFVEEVVCLFGTTTDDGGGVIVFSSALPCRGGIGGGRGGLIPFFFDSRSTFFFIERNVQPINLFIVKVEKMLSKMHY